MRLSSHPRRAVLAAALAFACASSVSAQVVTYRGSFEAKGTLFLQEARNDPERSIGDARARLDVFVKPVEWVQFAGGFDALANSYRQVDSRAVIDLSDRGLRRPALSARRLSMTLTRQALTLEVGKQFVRWGKADVVTPTDRFAPRDFLAVIDAEFLAVRAARLALATGADTVEGVVSVFTPSRTPLLDQRWNVTPPGNGAIALDDRGSRFPSRPQVGARWSHTGRGFEHSVLFFDGFNHLPNIELTAPMPAGVLPARPVGTNSAPLAAALVRTFPTLTMYGGDVAVPTRWVTLKGEMAYFRTRSADTDEYALYVVQVERQTGEWLLLGGYAGEVVTRAHAHSNFAPDRGASRAFIARASYTIDPNRSAAVETAIRTSGGGVYVKGELSKATGRHWRTTFTGAAIRGEPDDFLGQYRRNSHVGLSLRYSF
jgi:hypothetical protein